MMPDFRLLYTMCVIKITCPFTTKYEYCTCVKWFMKLLQVQTFPLTKF